MTLYDRILSDVVGEPEMPEFDEEKTIGHLKDAWAGKRDISRLLTILLANESYAGQIKLTRKLQRKALKPVIEQFKQDLLEALPEKKKPTSGFSRKSYSYPDLGYNQALAECIAAIERVVGDEDD